VVRITRGHCAILMVLALGLLGRPTVALAHAALLSSDPPDGAVLTAPPTSVALRFDEEVGLIQLRLVGPGAAEVLPGEPPRVDGSVLRARYPAGMQPGTYLLSYRVTSVDSHPVAGTIVFGVGLVDGPIRETAAGPVSPDTGRWILPSLATRWLFYLSVVTAAGGTLFRLLVAEVPDQLRRLLLTVALVGVGLAALQIGLRGALLADAPSGALLSSPVWQLGATTTLASSLLVAVLGLFGCAASLVGTARAWRITGGIAALLVVASFPLTGHAATAAPRWLMMPALTMHAAIAVFWIGAFWPLWVLLRGEAGVAAFAARRFSRLAVPAVSLLAVASGTLATVQVAHPAALFDTRYGLLVFTKLLLFVSLLGLAVWNRQRLTPALVARAPDASPRLQRTIGIEAVLGVIILAVTATLTLTSPSRTLTSEAALREHASHQHDAGSAIESTTAITQDRGITALIKVTPARAGHNTVRVSLNTAQDSPAPPKEIWLELSLPGAGIASVRRPLTRDASGSWIYEGPELAIPGHWTVRIEALLGDFDQVALSTEVIIQ
jgi:copper transport protein